MLGIYTVAEICHSQAQMTREWIPWYIMCHLMGPIITSKLFLKPGLICKIFISHLCSGRKY